MNCLHPFKRKYKDPITGEVKEVLCPCGHCINCLHQEQDMWSIRLGETGKQYKQMIFDTLTIRPSAMRTLIDYTKPTKEGYLYGTTVKWMNWKVNAMMKKYTSFKRYYPNYSYESWKLLKKNNFKVPYFPKEEVQKWLKRGRERYKRDTGIRTDICYFLVQEYGSSTSRPHFHILVFGMNLLDYQKYFGHPWNRDFGFTRPVWKRYTPWEKKDYNCIVRYVSKYITKGDFSNSLVKEGIMPQPYRLISKGIGAGYLNQSKFDIWKSNEFTRWMSISKMSDDTYNTKLEKLLKEGKDISGLEEKYKMEKFDVSVALFNKENNGEYIDLSSITESQWNNLRVYYDEGGFPHKLPQYYKNKLFRKNNEKNIYQFEVQNVLQQDAELYYNQGIQEFAYSLGYRPEPIQSAEDSPLEGLSVSEKFMVDYLYSIEQKSQATSLAERRKIRLDNFYNRSRMNESAPALA